MYETIRTSHEPRVFIDWQSIVEKYLTLLDTSWQNRRSANVDSVTIALSRFLLSDHDIEQSARQHTHVPLRCSHWNERTFPEPAITRPWTLVT